MRCDYLTADGRCSGRYEGLGCIKEKCRTERRCLCQFSTPEGSYCLKYRLFECVGPDHCGTLEQYREFVKQRRENARA